MDHSECPHLGCSGPEQLPSRRTGPLHASAGLQVSLSPGQGGCFPWPGWDRLCPSSHIHTRHRSPGGALGLCSLRPCPQVHTASAREDRELGGVANWPAASQGHVPSFHSVASSWEGMAYTCECVCVSGDPRRGGKGAVILSLSRG